jgi:hypothetical protein
MLGSRNLLLSLLLCLTFSGVTHGNVVIYFEEIGDDVRISALGTLALDPSRAVVDETFSDTFNQSGQFQMYGLNGTGYDGRHVGFSTSTLLDSVSQSAVGFGETFFGFGNTTVFFDEDDITGGDISMIEDTAVFEVAVSEITWHPSKDFLIFEDTSLSDLDAEYFDNQLAWTAYTTGDTIVYNTGPAPEVSIPEPKHVGMQMGAILTLALVARRREVRCSSAD